MNVIKLNPFRILGITGNSSEKELQKQISIIKAFARVGKTKEFKYDFGFIGDIPRSLEDIQQASSKIEQEQNKLYYSLFWFVNGNKIDETALGLLKEENIDKAIDIWEKTLKENVSSRNYTAYMNLSTLLFALSAIDKEFDKQKLQKGLLLKGKLINSEILNDYSALVTGNKNSGENTELNKKFTDEIIDILKPHLDKKNGIKTRELISFFDSYPSEIQKFVVSIFTEVPISNIENQVEKSASKRKDRPFEGNKIGLTLYENILSDIKYLKQILGAGNVQCQMVINKAANELIQCSIEYFNYYVQSKKDIDPGEDALDLATKADSLGASGQVKKRIADNRNVIQNYVKDKPNREKKNLVKEEFETVEKMIKQLQNKTPSIANATSLISNCKQYLKVIKSKLGEKDELYLMLSSAVAANAQGMVVLTVNDAVQKREKYVKYLNAKQNPFGQFGYQDPAAVLNRFRSGGFNPPYAPEYSMSQLKSVIGSAWSAIKKIGSLDMNQKEKQLYEKNKQNLKSLANQLKVPTEGCYIATVVYGNYDHPQVLKLRKVRDEVLDQYLFGKMFIKTYYLLSPTLVKILKEKKRMKNAIRNFLDWLIKYLKL